MGISINVPFYYFNCSLLFNPALVFYQSNYIINSYLLYRRHRYLKRLKVSWPSLSAILKQGRLLQPPPELRRPLKRKKPSQVNNCFIFFPSRLGIYYVCRGTKKWVPGWWFPSAWQVLFWFVCIRSLFAGFVKNCLRSLDIILHQSIYWSEAIFVIMKTSKSC